MRSRPGLALSAVLVSLVCLVLAATLAQGSAGTRDEARRSASEAQPVAAQCGRGLSPMELLSAIHRANTDLKLFIHGAAGRGRIWDAQHYVLISELALRQRHCGSSVASVGGLTQASQFDASDVPDDADEAVPLRRKGDAQP